VAILLDLVLVLGNEVLPAFGREFGYSVEQRGSSSGALVIPEESDSRLPQGLQSFRNMRRMDASFKNARAFRLRFPSPWRGGGNG